MRKKLLTLFMVIAMTISILPLHAESVSAMSMTSYRGDTCTSNENGAATIDYVMTKYKMNSTYPGTGQCWGYAEKVSSMIAATRTQEYYTGKKFTKANFDELCSGIKAGSHIRLSKNKEFNGYSGHSVVLMKVSEDLVCWADNNFSWDNTVAYYTGTMDDFMSMYGKYEYINMLAETTSYKVYSKAKLSSRKEADQSGIGLYWTKASGAEYYNIYRSTSKTGTYKKIGQTTECNYIDAQLTPGKWMYYKVKAVSGSTKTASNIASNYVKLTAPQVQVSSDAISGMPVLTWEPVENATSYTIYQWSFDEEKYVKLKNVKTCSFTEDRALEDGTYLVYGVRANYNGISRAASETTYCYTYVGGWWF